MPSLRHISLRYQFALWVGLAVTIAVLTTGWVIHVRVKENLEQTASDSLQSASRTVQRMITTALTLSIRSHLRGIAEENVAILEKLYKDSQTGRMKEAEARTMAEGILLSQTIGRTGYIYGISSQGIITVHPNEGMKNRDMSDHWLSKAQVSEKNGFLEYQWKNPGEARERQKVLYMSYFEPWDLIVSVTSYKDEFLSLFDLEGLRADILSFGSDRAGSVFILDSQGDFLVRSGGSELGRVSSPEKTWPEIFSQIQSFKNGQVKQALMDDESGRSREIMVFFRYIHNLDWYVGSYAYLDEVHAHLDQVRHMILATTLIILALMLPLSLYLGRILTRPMTRLAGEMKEAEDDAFDIRADEGGFGEVGDLARGFNTFMGKLKEANRRLVLEIEKRGEAEGQLLLFAEVYKNALEGISITDAEGRIIAVNQAFTEITGYPEQEVLGRNPRVLKSDRHDDQFYREMWERITNEGNWSGEIWNRRKSGEAYPEILSISAIRNADGQTTHYVAVFHDISEMKSQQEAIKHQAYHDALTGLPNRYLARDRLTMALHHARRQKERVAVFFLDMDNFKYVNDSLGHACGDILLQLFGQRLKRLVREQDTVARLGGDEFLVIGLNMKSDKEVVDLADRMIQGIQAPFQVEGHELMVTFSLGITNYPEDGDDAQTLIKNADVAMYESKGKGKNQYAIFSPALKSQAAFRMELVREFRKALTERQFKVYYQPKISASLGKVTGVEALVRWEKQDRSLVSPADFIPLAEETGLILPLGRQVLEIACRQVCELNRQMDRSLSLAVNLSPLQFEQPDMADEVLAILDETGLDPALLELEITETTMMTDLSASVKQLNIFQEEGISIAVDDFGTGYSSLYYLKALPISTLKIDRSFIRDMTLDRTDAKIVETIVLMAGNLGLGVVAEGVETGEQLALLTAFGCDQIQGFYFARPMPFDETLAYCLEKNGRPHGNT